MVLLTAESVYRNPETGELHDIHELPEDRSKMIKDEFYVVGDYIYPYVGTVSSMKDVKPGTIFRIGSRYIVMDHKEEDQSAYTLNNICDRESEEIKLLTSKGRPSGDELLNHYIYQYDKGCNLMITNRDKLICSGEIFAPEVESSDDPLKIVTKMIILYLKISLNSYRNKFDKEYGLDNMRSSLTGTTKNMSIAKFLAWCRLLELDWEITLEDMSKDVNHPINRVLTLSNYETPYMEIENNDKGIFTVALDEGEDPLKRGVKMLLGIKQADMKDYRHKGTTPHLINNMRSALKSKQKMTMPYFMAWCEILDIRYTIRVLHRASGVWFKATEYEITTNAPAA